MTKGTVMEALRHQDDSFELRVSNDELRILSNSVNEALEALPESEISIRMGATPEEVRAVRASFRRIWEELRA